MKRQFLRDQVKICDFAFSIFRQLREMDGIDDAAIKESLCPGKNNEAVFKAGES